MNISDIQREAYATASSKGWYATPLCTKLATSSTAPQDVDANAVLAKHALIHSELTEAVTALDEDDVYMRIDTSTGKPEGFVVEVADALIRIADTTQALGLVIADADEHHTVHLQYTAREIRLTRYAEQRAAVLGHIAHARQCIDLATEAVRVDDWHEYLQQMVHAWLTLASICAGLGLDLGDAIATKMVYNKTRPHRHGGKKA